MSLRRSDGSSIPWVVHTNDGDESVVARVTDGARRRIESPPPIDAQYVQRAVATQAPLERAPSAASDGGSRIDLKFAEADAAVQREYAQSLEDELSHLRGVLAETDAAFDNLVSSFDEKERYIDSLLSVRVKKWMFGRIPNRKT